MHLRRLCLSGEHQRRALVRLEVLGDRVDVGLGACRRRARPRPRRRVLPAIARAKPSIALAFIGSL